MVCACENPEPGAVSYESFKGKYCVLAGRFKKVDAKLTLRMTNVTI
jgi:hypothetical protein